MAILLAGHGKVLPRCVSDRSISVVGIRQGNCVDEGFAARRPEQPKKSPA